MNDLSMKVTVQACNTLGIGETGMVVTLFSQGQIFSNLDNVL